MPIVSDFVKIILGNHDTRSGSNETGYTDSFGTGGRSGGSDSKIVDPVTYLKAFYVFTKTFVTTAFAVHRYPPPLLANICPLATLIS
ncbi:MAG: hypothetical protein ACR2PS_05085 [Pseudomonadales bacterium]